MNNKFVLHYIGIVLAICFFCACSSNLPAKYVNVEEDSLSIYPNYKNIIIPYNIAPLNFQVENEISECVVQITSGSGNVFSVCSGREGKILFPKKTWKRLLEENKNKSILVDVYVRKGKDWFRYPTFKWDVSADPVDPYVTCRLIEPLYNAVGKISLCQFDLENGTQKTLADNKRHMEDVQHKANPVCVNCHIKQKNGSKNSLFFSRGSVGGMVLTYQGKVKLVDTKAGDMRVSAVFSSWHPNKP